MIKTPLKKTVFALIAAGSLAALVACTSKDKNEDTSLEAPSSTTEVSEAPAVSETAPVASDASAPSAEIAPTENLAAPAVAETSSPSLGASSSGLGL